MNLIMQLYIYIIIILQYLSSIAKKKSFSELEEKPDSIH